MGSGTFSLFYGKLMQANQSFLGTLGPCCRFLFHIEGLIFPLILPPCTLDRRDFVDAYPTTDVNKLSCVADRNSTTYPIKTGPTI